jgi:hypothetical protein
MREPHEMAQSNGSTPAIPVQPSPSPPIPPKPQYFVVVNSKRRGPYYLEQLRHSNIHHDMLVWHHGMPRWVPARELPELNEFISELPPPIPFQPSTSPAPAMARPVSDAVRNEALPAAEHESQSSSTFTPVGASILVPDSKGSYQADDEQPDSIKADDRLRRSHRSDDFGFLSAVILGLVIIAVCLGVLGLVYLCDYFNISVFAGFVLIKLSFLVLAKIGAGVVAVLLAIGGLFGRKKP